MKTIYLGKLPKCVDCKNDAEYDAPTRHGHWGYRCKTHYNKFCPNGTGTKFKLSMGGIIKVEGIMILDDWGDASVICPLCDNEQSIEVDGVAIYCTNCGCYIKVDPFC